MDKEICSPPSSDPAKRAIPGKMILASLQGRPQHRSAPQRRVSIQHNSPWETSCHAMAPADFSLGIMWQWCCFPSACGSHSTGPSSWEGRVWGHTASSGCQLGFLCFTKISVWPTLPILGKLLLPSGFGWGAREEGWDGTPFSKTFSPRSLINKSDFAKHRQENEEKHWCWSKLFIIRSIIYWTSWNGLV